MTMRIFQTATPLAIAVGVFLSACGGGSENGAVSAGTPAKIGSTDDVAVLVTGFKGALGTLGQSGVEDKATQAKRGPMAKSFKPKATSTENCDGGGSVSFTDDTATRYTDDGLTVANSCKSTSSSGSSSFSSTFNGKSADRCTDSAQTASNCNALTTRIADGASGNSTLDFAFSGNEGGTRVDLEVRVKADLTDSTSGNTDSGSFSGTIEINDKVEKLSATALFDNVQTSYTYNPSTGGGSETIQGSFGFSASASKCAIGKVTIRTDSPLIYSSDFNTTAGQITVTDGAGQSARVNFNSDGSYTVTLSNGQTRTYTADNIDDLC